MPDCPKCGRSAAKELSPGFFECRNLQALATPSNPLDGNSAPVAGASAICGHRFQVGGRSAAQPDIGSCSCGLFAVGKCQRCNAPFCGECGRKGPEGYVCLDCQIKDNAAERDAESARIAELEANRSEREARLEASAAEFMSLLASVQPDQDKSIPATDVVDAALKISRAWQQDFRRQFLVANVTEKKSRFGKVTRTVGTPTQSAGWLFNLGSRSESSYGEFVRRHRAGMLLEDGRFAVNPRFNYANWLNWEQKNSFDPVDASNTVRLEYLESIGLDLAHAREESTQTPTQFENLVMLVDGRYMDSRLA